jgi:hypothetical protein
MRYLYQKDERALPGNLLNRIGSFFLSFLNNVVSFTTLPPLSLSLSHTGYKRLDRGLGIASERLSAYPDMWRALTDAGKHGAVWGTSATKWDYDQELHNLYSSLNVMRVIKSRRMWWAGHVVRRWRAEKSTPKNYSKDLKVRNHLGDIDIDGRIATKVDLK